MKKPRQATTNKSTRWHYDKEVADINMSNTTSSNIHTTAFHECAHVMPFRVAIQTSANATMVRAVTFPPAGLGPRYYQNHTALHSQSTYAVRGTTVGTAFGRRDRSKRPHFRFSSASTALACSQRLIVHQANPAQRASTMHRRCYNRNLSDLIDNLRVSDCRKMQHNRTCTQ